jgi:hypothetical protein
MAEFIEKLGGSIVARRRLHHAIPNSSGHKLQTGTNTQIETERPCIDVNNFAKRRAASNQDLNFISRISYIRKNGVPSRNAAALVSGASSARYRCPVLGPTSVLCGANSLESSSLRTNDAKTKPYAEGRFGHSLALLNRSGQHYQQSGNS